LDLSKWVIQMINSSNKTLEDMLKIHNTCKKSKTKDVTKSDVKT
jgi:hypothetical protein